MSKSIDSAAADFASVRAGRANAAVLDRITVDYYGTPTPIQQIAAISTPDPRILQISPWDNSALKSIEKAILNSDLGMDAFKKMEKASEITEDDLKQMEKDLQKLTDESSKKIDELLARKEKELMEI